MRTRRADPFFPERNSVGRVRSKIYVHENILYNTCSPSYDLIGGQLCPGRFLCFMVWVCGQLCPGRLLVFRDSGSRSAGPLYPQERIVPIPNRIETSSQHPLRAENPRSEASPAGRSQGPCGYKHSDQPSSPAPALCCRAFWVTRPRWLCPAEGSDLSLAGFAQREGRSLFSARSYLQPFFFFIR